MAENDDRIELREGRPVDMSALEGNPFERRRGFGGTLRAAGTRGWAIGALAIAVLYLGWHLTPKGPQAPVTTTSAAVTRLQATDPPALMQKIVDDLRAVGVEASGYEQLGISGVDADLALPVSPEVRSTLERHHIPVPANGQLRVQIAPLTR